VTEFRLELPPSAGARPAATLVARALRTWDIDDPSATVRLVVSELIENVHLHTGGSGELHMALNEHGIMIAVADTSPAVPVVKDPGTAPAGGRGLHIIRALAQDWGTEAHADGKIVWARIAVIAPAQNGQGTTRRSVRAPAAAELAPADPPLP
jgi:anti-sigma regulatory factor (Ser/Thr protein kinase)